MLKLWNNDCFVDENTHDRQRQPPAQENGTAGDRRLYRNPQGTGVSASCLEAICAIASFCFSGRGSFSAIYAFLQYLYWYPLESTGYTALIVLTLLVLISALDYRRYRRRLRQLDSLTEAWISLEREMPDTRDPLEQRYQQLILKQRVILTEEKEKQNAAQKQREELVTMWMHQIKLPLASLSLILESLEPEDTISASHLNEMKLALMRTEQYAQTALKATD